MSEKVSETLLRTEEKSIAPLPDEARVAEKSGALSSAGARLAARQRTKESLISATTVRLQALRKRQPAVFWPWLGGLLVVGLVIVAIVTYSTWNWLNTIQRGFNANQPVPVTISTLKVQRSAIYANINFTLIDVQYATSFSDDPIHVGQAIVRATFQVKNPTQSAINLEYYDVARLLVPNQQPIVPTNLALAAVLQPGSTQTGWIDFPVAKKTTLQTLTLQFGNAATNEMLVAIPVSGAYNSNQFNSRVSNQSMTIDYLFKGVNVPAYWLHYHLTSVEVSDSYNGTETYAGQQIYILNFSVDNPNRADVSPGYGYDYLRLNINGNRAPFDNTLPSTFPAGAQGVTGHVAYRGPAGLQSLSLVFLIQAYAGQYSYTITL